MESSRHCGRPFALTLAHYLDLKNNNGSFEIVAGANLTNLCTDAPTATLIARDLACALSDLQQSGDATRLEQLNSDLVLKIRDDIKEAGDQFFVRGGGQILPDACYDNIFTPLGINASNYLSILGADAFAVPS